MQRRTDHVMGRPPELVGKPGAHHAHARAPMLAQLRAQAGITDDAAGELLKEQRLSLGVLRALEGGEYAPRLTISRATAALGLSHAAAKAEI